MGRSKPRTNKRPPPKIVKTPTEDPARPSADVIGARNPNIPYESKPVGLKPQPPHPNGTHSQPNTSKIETSLDRLTYALQNFSTSALGRLDTLPKLNQAQLTAIAGAAAGITDSNWLPGQGDQLTSALYKNENVDLPASLAALFEAKLTLDREKAKLLKMQKELKGYRDGVAAATAGSSAKGKEVMADDLGECTCGRQHSLNAHSAEVYEEEEYYSDEYDCEDCCDCSCHYVECEHDGPCDCEPPHDHDHDHEHHHHDHDHHHHDHDHFHDHEHVCSHHHYEEPVEPLTVPNPYLPQNSTDTANMTYQQALDAYRDERDQAARGLDEIGGMLRKAGWTGGTTERLDNGETRPLAEDPERLDEHVRDLFNWIKAVVWTIEQAAIAAGRKGGQVQASAT